MLSVGNLSAWHTDTNEVDSCIGLFGLPRITLAAANSLRTLLTKEQTKILVFINTWYRKTEIPETWHNIQIW